MKRPTVSIVAGTRSGSRSYWTPASVYFRAGPLAVTRLFEGWSPGKERFRREFVITHVPTGRTMGTPAYRFRTVRRAREALEAISGVCDWRSVRNTKLPDIAHEMVPHILACAEDCAP